MLRLRPDTNREQQEKIWGFNREQHPSSDCASKKPSITVKGEVRGENKASMALKTEREKAIQRWHRRI